MQFLTRLNSKIKQKVLVTLIPICLGLTLTPNTSYSFCGAVCAEISEQLGAMIVKLRGLTTTSESNAETNQRDADTAAATKSWDKTKWLKNKKFLGIMLVLGVTGIIETINTQTKQTHKGKAMDAYKSKNTKKQSPKSLNNVYGSKSSFTNMVNAYKQGDKTCHKDKSSGKKKCYSNLNSGTMHNHTKFQNKGHEKAAKNYSHNASGGAIGVAKPNNKWKATPSSVSYNAYYKTQSSVGSHTTNTMSQNIGARQTLNHKGKKKSQASHQKQSNQTSIQEHASAMSNAPVIGPIYSTATSTQKMNTQMHKHSKKMGNINTSLSGTNTHFSHANHRAFGKQMHRDAQNSTQGEPHKRHPHE